MDVIGHIHIPVIVPLGNEVLPHWNRVMVSPRTGLGMVHTIKFLAFVKNQVLLSKPSHHQYNFGDCICRLFQVCVLSTTFIIIMLITEKVQWTM